MIIIFLMALPEGILLLIKYFFFQNQKYIVQIQPQNMALSKVITYLMKPKEVGVALMLMQWEPGEIIPQVHHIKNIMEIYGGGFVRRVRVVVRT